MAGGDIVATIGKRVAKVSNPETEEVAEKTEHVSGVAKPDGKVHWTYEGDLGPDRWATLSKEFETCRNGTMQSPIDISGTFAAGGAPIEFDYGVTSLDVVHNGHTVQINYEPGSFMTVDGKRYDLLQLHFHVPSEHSVSAKQAAMEMHLVHKNAEGQLAVIGVMMDPGARNRALGEVWAAMPREAGKTYKNQDILTNARDFLPDNRTYYRYMGSLTTPPCTEGVNWFVMTNPVRVDLRQVNSLTEAVGFNARPVQAANNRLVIAPSGEN